MAVIVRLERCIHSQLTPVGEPDIVLICKMPSEESNMSNQQPGASAVDAAITSRRSVRGFLPRPVARETIEEILSVAARAPSGTNMQPWRVYVLCGESRSRLVAALLHAFDHEDQLHRYEYKYYPDEFFEPFLGRRRKVGFDLYSLVGVGKGDLAGRRAQHRKNYTFFGAPVGMIFTMNRNLNAGSWLDYGMFLQNIMIAARGRGLDTCAQVAFNQYHRVIRQELSFSAEELVVCGMALGYEDPAADENTLQTERVPVAEFASFFDC